MKLLPGGGVTLGVEPLLVFPTHEVRIGHGDVLALYTDGLIENTRDALAGERRLIAAFAAEPATAESLVDGILAIAHNDDVALLTMQVLPQA